MKPCYADYHKPVTTNLDFRLSLGYQKDRQCLEYGKIRFRVEFSLPVCLMYSKTNQVLFNYAQQFVFSIELSSYQVQNKTCPSFRFINRLIYTQDYWFNCISR